MRRVFYMSRFTFLLNSSEEIFKLALFPHLLTFDFRESFHSKQIFQNRTILVAKDHSHVNVQSVKIQFYQWYISQNT